MYLGKRGMSEREKGRVACFGDVGWIRDGVCVGVSRVNPTDEVCAAREAYRRGKRRCVWRLVPAGGQNMAEA